MAAKPVRVKIGKWNGDDCYSYAVFVDNRPVRVGLNRSMAVYYQNEYRKKLGCK